MKWLDKPRVSSHDPDPTYRRFAHLRMLLGLDLGSTQGQTKEHPKSTQIDRFSDAQWISMLKEGTLFLVG